MKTHRKTESVRTGGAAVRRTRDRAKSPKAPKQVEDNKLLRLETSVLLKLCNAMQSPRSLMIKLLLEAEEWDQIVQLTINSRHYLEANHSKFRDDYLLTSLLSKSPTIPASYCREDEAVKGFFKAESVCEDTNVRLSAYSESKVMPLTLDVHKAIHFARLHIEKVLGTSPSRGDLDFCERSMRFGPGSTTGLSGNVTSGAKYARRELDVTPRLAGFGVWCMPRLWRATGADLKLRTTSKFSTVPKNAKTDRGICIEPDLNVYVQLGIGALLRRKLRFSGLDLDTAAEWNRYLASVAVDWRLTTLDLRAASDTLARECVWLLCPNDWVELLLLARVDETLVRGQPTRLNKWSSMGNGYTFELESLIFNAVLVGCCEVLGLTRAQNACFGDDLIFPSEATELVTRTLEFLGFSANVEKSFRDGLFRESCGSDFFAGHPVRPVYFKGSKKGESNEEMDNVQIRYSYANALVRWAGPLGSVQRDARVLPAWLRVFSSVTPDLRFRLPHGSGDNGFGSDWDEAQATNGQLRTPKGEQPVGVGYGGHWYREYFRPMLLDKSNVLGAYIATLAGQALEASHGQPMRGRYKTAVTRWAYSLEWPNRGPWQTVMV